jgi:hypothetical protein
MKPILSRIPLSFWSAAMLRRFRFPFQFWLILNWADASPHSKLPIKSKGESERGEASPHSRKT